MYIISKNLQFEIFKLQQQGFSPYAISQQLKINYRTADKYVQLFREMEKELAEKIETAFFDVIVKNDDFFTKLYQNTRGDINGSE